MERQGGGQGGGRPPWWPEGEAWPPAAGWTNARQRFLRRVGCLVGALVLFMFVAGSFLSWIFGGGPGNPRDPYRGPPFGFFGLLLLGFVAFLIVRAVRRTAAPIGDVMAAAERVAGGDYAV